MKRWWFGPKKYIDEEKEAAERKALNDIYWCIQNNDLDRYLRLVAALLGRPLTAEEIEHYTEEFRQARSIHPND